MTVLTQRMREELVRRNYAPSTIRTYLMAVEEFRRYAKKRLDHLRPDDIRHYQVALLEDKKLAVGTVALRISALRFFYLKVLKKYSLRYELPYPKNPKWARRLPPRMSEGISRRCGGQRLSPHRSVESVCRCFCGSTGR